MYSFGVCHDDLSLDTQTTYVAIKPLLKKLPNQGAREDDNDDGIPGLKLFDLVRNAPDAQVGDGPPPHILVLVLTCVRNPVLPVFIECVCQGDVAIDALVKPLLDAADQSVFGLKGLSVRMAEHGRSFRTHRLLYTFEALNVFKITGIDDVTDQLQGKKHKTQKKDAVSAIMKARAQHML